MGAGQWGRGGTIDRHRDFLRQALDTARERGLVKIEREAVELLSGA